MESGSTSTTPDLPPEVVDEVAKMWAEVLKTPTIAGAHLTEDDNFVKISSTWSVNDTGKKENVKFQRNFVILKSSLVWNEGSDVLDSDALVMTTTSATPMDGKLIAVSRDGNRKAILVEKPGTGNGKDKQQYIQVWSGETFLKSYDLGDLDKHKAVYTNGEFGTTMVWDISGEKLAYLAEKKVPKPKPFFVSDFTKESDKGSEEKKDSSEPKEGPKGEEYALKQSWGEQMTDAFFTVVVILDTKTDKFNIIEFPSDQFPTDLHWVESDRIIGVSYKIQDWRLGLIYCTNRESRIFQVNADGTNLRFISSEGRAAMCPRVRPDGTFVIWQERAVDRPHRRARNIMGSTLSKDSFAPVALYESAPPNLPVYENFPKNCWSRDNQAFFMTLIRDGINSLTCFRLDEGKVEQTPIISDSPGIDGVAWVGDQYLLVVRSSAFLSHCLELVEVAGKNRRAVVTRSNPPPGITETYSTSHFFGQASIPSFCTSPENQPAKSVPLIVWIHGGPHAHFLDSFVPEGVLLTRLGFALLKINYIGSTGASSRDETDDLLGQIGTLDVIDCQSTVEKVLQATPCLDPGRVGVWGGSHGGFITCHLISQFPDFYKAAVSRNPVVDLNVMIGISDITDWLYAEAGLPWPINLRQGFIPAVKSVEDAEKLFNASPISRVSNVKAATLLCVGTEDLRVPAAQGFAFYRALKAYGRTSEIRVYPDCHALSSLPVRMDNVIHAALWFKKFIK